MTSADAAVVGAGPNGLAAAVTLARAGLRVRVHERAGTVGGGLRGAALFDSDVTHDLCAAVHPMAAASAFFRAFDLPARGVRMLHPDLTYAHPLDDGRAALAHRDLARTCDGLGADGPRWRRLMEPLVHRSQGVTDLLLSTQRTPPNPVIAALLAPRILGNRLRGNGLRTEDARALLSGVAAHAVGPLPSLPSAAIAVLLGHLAHATGWPLPQGGSGRIADALLDDLRAHGGTVQTGHHVTDLAELDTPVVLLDTTPRAFADLAGDRLPPRARRALLRFRYGPGAAKADFLVSGPIPWANPEVGRAGTVHLGGTHAHTLAVERAAAAGEATDEPFALVVDPAVTDPSRAAADGRRPVWAYAHVPNGDTRDPVPLLTRRIERYAPGFADTVLAARGVSAAAYEHYNPNYVGGDIGSGAITLRQSLLRPVPRRHPYRTPLRGVYLCSASTPPGPSVHGMCGHLAALDVLRREFGVRSAPPLGPPAGARDHAGRETV
ncbi:NAD(P)/FAD-dependent oxidoreductase [Streptomyces sp. DSM 42041]|uniref:NAD(P)/FAD-dependent oxidoreductase n=1 Tax=Streptomyces hazeniae TaxID=3075538 RepID=A0ABU2NMU9_9ACTN|nr:NAD(P)/FAD-dependent oxidoreductase [Streptomyces sp. DSM 42041]MDT0377543.1 NAD(P)/FAD-dependent oxidoreductase [Streptomyces sp. DSM 42041]